MQESPTRSDSAAGTSRTPAARPVVLVTGASSGIGAAVATRIATEWGWHVLVSGRDAARLGETAAATGGIALPVDLAEPDAAQHLVRAALAHSGRVDVLVAAAGTGWAGPFVSMPPAAIDSVLTVNLTAVLRLVRLVLPGMVSRGTGHVVLIGSLAGRIGVRDEAVYSASKGALSAFADSLRYELVGTGVRVSTVLPSVVDTPFFTRRGTPYRRRHPKPVPARRVADAVLEVLAHGREEMFVPRWMGFPVRAQAVAPGLFRKLATRFG